uniref:Uncharacterized protein n=1 Tax=Globodera rostochiensis TaxID=31243 RepID=A0A914IDM0_GLORO
MASNSFFVFLPSNVTDYPDNQPNKFRVRLPKSIEFNGSWVCGLHSVSYPYSWHSTIGTLDDQWINIHFLDVFDPQDRDILRIIRLPVPKASLKKVGQLRDFLAKVLKHHSRLLQSLTQNKEVTEFVDRPEILASPPPLKRRKRSTGETLPLPPSVEVDETLPLPPSADVDKTTLPSPPRERDQHLQQKHPQQSKQHQPYNQNQLQHLQQQQLQKTNQNHPYSQNQLQHLYQHLQQQQPHQTRQHHPAPKPGEKERAQQMLSVLVGEDRVKSSAIEYLKAIVDSVDIQYEEVFERFKLVVNRAGASKTLRMCGTTRLQRLTENVIIGNTLSSLLRVVSVTGAVQGEYNEKIYDSPIYARVLPREISEIEIELRTMDSGRLVPFAYGTTMVVLIFKKTGGGAAEVGEDLTYFKGSSPYQRGYGIQHGAGVGDVFRGLWRFFLPILRRVGTTVGAEALNTGQRVLERVANEGAPLKETLYNEGKRGIDTVLEKGGLPKQFDNDSVNSITNALDFFHVPPTNVSVSSSKVFELLPSNPLTDTPYHFKLHSSQNFIDLSKCYLFTEFRIRKENASGLLVNLDASDNLVCPIQMIEQTFIRNNRTISTDTTI